MQPEKRLAVYEAIRNHVPYSLIKSTFHLSRSQLRSFYSDLSIPFPQPLRNEERFADVLEALREGRSYHSISRDFNIFRGTLRRLSLEYGIPHPSQHPQAKPLIPPSPTRAIQRQETLKALLLSGVSCAEAAAKSNYSPRYVRSVAKKLGIPLLSRPVYPLPPKEELEALIASGATIRSLEKKYHASYERIVRALGRSPAPRTRRTEESPHLRDKRIKDEQDYNDKVTQDFVKLWEMNYTYPEIKALLSISEGRFRKILSYLRTTFPNLLKKRSTGRRKWNQIPRVPPIFTIDQLTDLST